MEGISIEKVWEFWLDDRGQIGGYAQDYSIKSGVPSLFFRTVRGAGHVSYDTLRRRSSGTDMLTLSYF